MSQTVQQQTCALLRQLAPQEGYTASLLDSVRFMRADRQWARTPVLYEPSIIIICQGSKRAFLADKMYRYDAQHYLVLSVPLPFSAETEATSAEPLLGLAIRLDAATLARLVTQVAAADIPLAETPASIISTPVNETLADSTLRLLQALSDPLEAQVLGPARVEEICFRVLLGEQGGAVRAALTYQGHFGRIARALQRIHADWQQPLDVPHLASEAGMSVPRFHLHFKSVTQTSPIQYLKSLRLHQARLMMIRDNLTAAGAAARVGYESESQFNREFKRMFGRTPADEARVMKCAFALLPPEQLSARLQAH
ncbi:AraC family transcriptional regulator [Pantoea dispersa]|uniref:AraC family transcriptional regulator n=1 Tax=Pantoea dispersa TaxID=59814 RepID=UPI002DB9A081|nr:AraC family transcriptional regulator [Pantoea dispersa]MEB5837202.1 AraC family transcriptional regulator [Pantoea dispersa]